MLFIQAIIAIVVTLATHASALPVETVQEDQTPTPGRALLSRGIPHCPVSYGERFEPSIPDDVKQDAARSLFSRVTYDKIGWKHPICSYWRVNCYSLQKYIRFTGSQGEIGTSLGHWYGDDGTELLAFAYWHNELGFAGDGGSAKIYPAHGFFFVCARGYINVVIDFPKIGEKGQGGWGMVAGNEQPNGIDPDGWEGPCKCFANDRWDIYGSDLWIEWRR